MAVELICLNCGNTLTGVMIIRRYISDGQTETLIGGEVCCPVCDAILERD